jgi:hypothetical protein
MTPADDDLLTALRSARPDPEYRPSPRSPEAKAMLAGILGARREPARTRRVTRRRLVLAGLPALAVAAVATLVAVSVTPSGPAPGQPSATTVRTAILDALRQRSGDILYQNTTFQISTKQGADVRRGWTYPAFPAVGQRVRHRSFDYRDGKPHQDIESIYTENPAMEQPTLNTNQGPRSAKIIGVDYPSRTWARFTTTTVPVDLTASPALIRSEIASGRFTVDGTVTLNGREAVKLSWTVGPAPFMSYFTLWVDSRTYVLLRSVQADPLGTNSAPPSRSHPGPVSTVTTTYQMRPATAASLKLLTPVIPAGFTRAAKVPGFDRIGK